MLEFLKFSVEYLQQHFSGSRHREISCKNNFSAHYDDRTFYGLSNHSNLLWLPHPPQSRASFHYASFNNKIFWCIRSDKVITDIVTRPDCQGWNMKEAARARPFLRQFRVYQLPVNKLSLACVSVRVFGVDFFHPPQLNLYAPGNNRRLRGCTGVRKKLTRNGGERCIHARVNVLWVCVTASRSTKPHSSSCFALNVHGK